MKRSDFIEKHKAYEKELNKYVLRMGMAIPLFFLVFSASLFFIDERVQKNPFWNFVWTVCFLLPMIGAAWWLFWITKMVTKKHDLCCPHCNAQFTGGSARIVIASGRCGTCGHRVLEDD